MHIGPYKLPNHIALAPMAGVTDLPFRRLCRKLGAGYVVSEMIASDPRLRHTRKSQLRSSHEGEVEPVAVQIAGSEPALMADAARYNVDRGAQIIDINMGCPAKKVWHGWGPSQPATGSGSIPSASTANMTTTLSGSAASSSV